MNRTGIIYKATSPSGKIYIGQTIKTLAQRKRKHHNDSFNKNSKGYNFKIARAIRKYSDSFEWITLHTDISTDNLNALEIEEISRHDSYKTGYNGTEGGGGSIGHSPSQETRKKMSESNKGKKHTDAARKKISEFHKGKKLSKETRKKISEAVSGENHGKAKLNFKAVDEIRIKYATGNYTQTKLAKEYSVGPHAICDVVNNITWKK